MPAASNGQQTGAFWPKITPYVVPPVAASLAIVPVFRDLAAKSALQKGLRPQGMTMHEAVMGGLKASPTVGVIVGTQMVLQSFLEKKMAGESKEAGLPSALASSAVVGAVSAPILAVFNGQTMGWGIRESLRKFSVKQGLAIAVQETAFVCGLSAADKVSLVMKEHFGDNKAVEYTAAFMSGAAGSLAGHPANTALTRWQSGMVVESISQSFWGAARKARAIGFFSVFYKFGKETMNSIANS